MAPVIIVGGGPVGLVSSILLSLQKIPNVLFERHPGTSIHPKACGLNQRTMEIFRHIGVEEEALRQSAPPETVSRTAWYTGLGTRGREIHRCNHCTGSDEPRGGGRGRRSRDHYSIHASIAQICHSIYSIMSSHHGDSAHPRRGISVKVGGKGPH